MQSCNLKFQIYFIRNSVLARIDIFIENIKYSLEHYRQKRESPPVVINSNVTTSSSYT